MCEEMIFNIITLIIFAYAYQDEYLIIFYVIFLKKLVSLLGIEYFTITLDVEEIDERKLYGEIGYLFILCLMLLEIILPDDYIVIFVYNEFLNFYMLMK